MAHAKHLLNYVPKRNVSFSQCLEGKKNFRKFVLANKRGSRLFKKQQAENPDPDIPVYRRGVRLTGYKSNGRFIEIPEMIPQLVVPDLKDCPLKPYVSYKVPDISQPEFTAKQLFDAVYATKISEDFKNEKLDEHGNPVAPSLEEKVTAQEAYINARKTGSDIF